MCIPNLDEISQSTVEIKLLTVLENGRSPYWNSISCFNLDPCVIIGMWFCISMPNFVSMRRSPAELWRDIDFYRAAQTRSSDENSVCPSVRPSVCPSHACIVTKRKKDLSRFLYHTKENLVKFSEKKNGWWGDSFYLKFWVNWPPLERNRRFWTDIRS